MGSKLGKIVDLMEDERRLECFKEEEDDDEEEESKVVM